MKSALPYRRDCGFSYTLGVFPSLELLAAKPERVQRLLLHSTYPDNEGACKLLARCTALGIRHEIADRALRNLSKKENCHAALMFMPYENQLHPDCSHVVLHGIRDRGNLGTILRTCAGFGFEDIALIGQCVDPFEPHTLRASMGAMFWLRLREYPDFSEYKEAFPSHALYPFALNASIPPWIAAQQARPPFSLIFGNEAAGLPEDIATQGQAVRIPHSDRIDSLNLAIAAGIGMYAFAHPQLEEV